MDEIKDLALGIREYPFPINISNKINNVLKDSGKFDWVNSGVGNYSTNTTIRSSKNYASSTEPLLFEKVKKYIFECTDEYCSKYGTSVSKKIDIGLLKYEVGGEYKYHSDASYSFYRTVSCLVYLNPSEYEGGETDFKYLGIKVKPDMPKLVLFPSNFIYNHAALPVTNGVKYVIVGWMNDVPEEV
jgi:predicted 2-oxoglutarate/Fe(II)-dependent dioxygenase YbiX